MQEEEQILDKGWCTVVRCGRYVEYKSKRRILGLPLVHVVLWPCKPSQKGFVVAKGVFAYGVFSIGVFSIGILTVGLCVVGTIALGLATALGNIALAGVAALGNIAITIGWGLGNIAVGYSAFGSTTVQYGPWG